MRGLRSSIHGQGRCESRNEGRHGIAGRERLLQGFIEGLAEVSIFAADRSEFSRI